MALSSFAPGVDSPRRDAAASGCLRSCGPGAAKIANLVIVVALGLLTYACYLKYHASAWNIGRWLCDCVLQFTRACAEERFLSVDPAYVQYQARVKYRLVPLVI